MMVFCYNIWGNWVDFGMKLLRYYLDILGKLMDFGLKLVKFGRLAARFFLCST